MMFEYKQLIIHVACEVVVFGVLIFWIHKRTSSLSLQIEELTQRVDDQEEKLQNHERILKQMTEMINKRGSHSKPSSAPKTESSKPHKKPKPEKKVEETQIEETESEMDERIRDELAELEISEDEEDDEKN